MGDCKDLLGMEFANHFQKLCQIDLKRFLFLVGMVAVTHLLLQTLMLPYGTALLSLLPADGVSFNGKLSTKSLIASNLSLVNAFESIDSKDSIGLVNNGDVSVGRDKLSKGTDGGEEYTEDSAFVEDGSVKNDVSPMRVANVMENSELENAPSWEKSSRTGNIGPAEGKTSTEQITAPILQMKLDDSSRFSNISVTNHKNLFSSASDASTSVDNAVFNGPVIREQSFGVFAEKEEHPPESNLTAKGNCSAAVEVRLRKKMRYDMPPKSVTLIDRMNRIFARHLGNSLRSMKPLWSSPREMEILDAKRNILDPHISKNDGELYAPIFRNVSRFLRSYELMESTLKVYVYRDGEKPIFHQPILKGLYASEGWFMKLMEGNKRFVVKDPRKAHLFYMPFSSRMLEYTLYVRNSHNRTNLRQYVKEYSERLAAKYPFWNRTGGMDHFLVACHDWAPYETRHHMENCIKALCNADVTAGFKIGRDVSLPETYVRSARNPLRHLGGKAPSKREILAFYAGNNHGYLRPILLKYWKDKDTDMKIYGPMPRGVTSKMNYIQHMKSSKYCLCPKGYEVNSPRIIEAIFYECVPVIISDNFVPPFFEVLNWEAFSVIVAEKDIPNLKDILLSIPEEKYLALQLAVRKVQQHFLWHAKPIKYDLFYMTLHSIWYSRVFQIKPKMKNMKVSQRVDESHKQMKWSLGGGGRSRE
ncbi:hypothetical protein Ancab_016845 [Ancistrocladus abbreviatus]